jgi:phenylacetaldehyde dehydrogenase
VTTFHNLLADISAPAGQGREIKDSATGAVVGYASKRTEADLDAAVALGREAQRGWAAKSHAERSDYLNRAVQGSTHDTVGGRADQIIDR